MYKPFIKLFRTPNRKYFYEPNKNEFITISDESYDFLQAVFNGDDSLTMPKEIQELMKKNQLRHMHVCVLWQYAIVDVLAHLVVQQQMVTRQGND